MPRYLDPIYERMILSSFTSKEKQAFFQLLCGAMVIDGVRDDREKAVINNAMERIGLSDAEREASRHWSTDEQIAVLKAMDNSKKMLVGKFMAQVILADGKVEPVEENWFKYIQELLEIPDIED